MLQAYPPPPCADGPGAHEPWLCFRCARDAPGSLRRNWAVTRDKARLRPNDKLFIAAPQDDDAAYDLFYRGIVLSTHPTYIEVLWSDFGRDHSNPERVPRESYRIWHGVMDPELWEDMGEFAYAPISRRLCPDTFAEIAAKHGIAPRLSPMLIPHGNLTRTAPGAVVTGAPITSTTRRFDGAAVHADSLQDDSDADATPQKRGPSRGRPPKARAEPAGVSRDDDGRNAAQLQAAADTWLHAVRAFGKRHGYQALAAMPSMLSMRRTMHLHPFALWLVVQVRLHSSSARRSTCTLLSSAMIVLQQCCLSTNHQRLRELFSAT